ncbi:hypothetical protein Pcinc_040668 [Petrolisthes cinctipes]|uniref:LRRCT domain-containing protein n=1 Tax=Petrolisthes cinctipes TaxID=88211 RepID=A0AAE1BL37_PETCI|nr:hypothetical protein Pcinc_040668 [Petrolisthes cinctipes]
MWTWLVVWSGLGGAVLAFCPNGCKCNDQVPSAGCVGVGLTVLPILLNPRLRHLNMAHNLISSISQSLEFFKQLVELDLSHNLLTSLGTRNLNEQHQLQELRLAYNNLTHLEPGALRGLHSLNILDLSHNGLKDLPAGVLDDAPRLGVLLLAHNSLHQLPQHTFRSLPSLHTLDLCNNYFRVVPTAALDYLYNIKSLLLCHNRLTHLDSHAFTTRELISLSLEANKIDLVASDAFQHLQKLKMLTLNDNMLGTVPVIPRSLDSLVLDKNNLTTITPETLQGVERLSTLDISYCPHLSRLHPDTFHNCLNLQRLTISHNPLLRHLPHGLLRSLPRLNRLDLSGNGLKTVSKASLPMASLQYLDLRDNLLVCNCSLRWLASVLAGVNTSLVSPDVQCSAPPKLKGLFLSRLRGSGLVCGWQGQVVAGSVVVVCCVMLLATLTLLLCRYQRRQKREKLGRGWPPGPLAPWPPDHHSAPTRHIMADEYLYHTCSSITKIPVTEV